MRSGELPHPSGPVTARFEDRVSAIDQKGSGSGVVDAVHGHTVMLSHRHSGREMVEEVSIARLYTLEASQVLAEAAAKGETRPARSLFAVLRVDDETVTASEFVPAPLRADWPVRERGQSLETVAWGSPDPDGLYEVVVKGSALDAALRLLLSHPTREVGLIPVGTIHFDPVERKPWLFVEEFAFGAEGTEISIEVPPSTVASIRARLRGEGNGRSILGTLHSHVLAHLVQTAAEGAASESGGGIPLLDPGPVAPRQAHGDDAGSIDAVVVPQSRQPFFSTVDRRWFEQHTTTSVHFVVNVSSDSVEVAAFGFGGEGTLVRMPGFHVTI